MTAIISAPDASGDIYIAGGFTTYNDRPVRPVVRIRPDGTLNESFTLASEIIGVTSLAPVDDGSGDIYVAEVQSLANRVVQILKVNADGSVDSAFPPGQVIYTKADTILRTNILTIVPVGDGSGRAYVCGAFDRYNGVEVSHIVLVTPTGTLEPSFRSAATPTFTVVPADDGSGDLYVMNWRIIDISGPTTASTDVYRLNANGSVDLAFKTLTTLPFGTLRAVLPVGDGSGDLFIGGVNIFLGTGDPNPDNFISLARVNPDGTFDLTSPRPAVNDGVSLLARAVDGTKDIFIAGQPIFGTDGTDITVEQHLRRFKADSSIDPAFAIGTVDGGISSVLPVPDGTSDLYVGGTFTTYNGVAAGNIVRLNANGTLDGS
ncbi:MAG TPA: delta-60 repeat domain-containing protein [Nitrospira sp.]|nr:delta-60 repeat domain-containing protein [Nitrospira sp.]